MEVSCLLREGGGLVKRSALGQAETADLALFIRQPDRPTLLDF